MSKLPDTRTVGQLLIIGFEGTEMTPRLSSLLSRLQPGGVILFTRNIASAAQTHKLLKDCQACVSTPLFACVDMEGGQVDRFREVFGPAPSAADVFATGDRAAFRMHGKIIGQCCRALGFNTDLAPVVDLAFDASRSVMSSRAVSADPKETVTYAREFLAGLRQAGVLGCGKHFPGLGEADLDTHHDLTKVAKPWQKLWEQDLYPYRVMRSEFPMVLISHANYPSVTHDDKPASLSKRWITDILRKKIGYGGLVLSDDLEMGGVLKAEPIDQAAVKHIGAGGDLCLICHTEDWIVRSYEALVREVERDRKFAARVKESVRRVLAFKRRRRELKRNATSPSPAKVEKLARQLWEFGEQIRLEAIPQEDSARREQA
jgi:beta-N-acetylhexosaminidase